MSATLGLAACALSSFCYGSMYVAVRKYDTGDGKQNVLFLLEIECPLSPFLPMINNLHILNIALDIFRNILPMGHRREHLSNRNGCERVHRLSALSAVGHDRWRHLDVGQRYGTPRDPLNRSGHGHSNMGIDKLSNWMGHRSLWMVRNSCGVGYIFHTMDGLSPAKHFTHSHSHSHIHTHAHIHITQANTTFILRFQMDSQEAKVKK